MGLSNNFFIYSPHEPEEGVVTLLLRFEHLFEAQELEDPSPINIKLNEDLFKGLRMTQMTEMALGGDRLISDVLKKFRWNKVKGEFLISIA